MQYFDEINNTGYAFLQIIEEPRNNVLSIIVNAGRVADYEEDTIVGKARPVIIDEDCPQYQVDFDSLYVAYQVCNESFATSNDYDQYIGRVLRIYSKSRYMDYILQHSIANFIFPNEMKHYGIVCEDHVIDVIALGEPTVSRIA